jgi:hypothetical protein
VEESQRESESRGERESKEGAKGGAKGETETVKRVSRKGEPKWIHLRLINV